PRRCCSSASRRARSSTKGPKGTSEANTRVPALRQGQPAAVSPEGIAARNPTNSTPWAHPTSFTARGMPAKYLRGIAMPRSRRKDVPSSRARARKRPRGVWSMLSSARGPSGIELSRGFGLVENLDQLQLRGATVGQRPLDAAPRAEPQGGQTHGREDGDLPLLRVGLVGVNEHELVGLAALELLAGETGPHRHDVRGHLPVGDDLGSVQLELEGLGGRCQATRGVALGDVAEALHVAFGETNGG